MQAITYFTSHPEAATDLLNHGGGENVTQYHRPHLDISLPPGSTVSRCHCRDPNTFEKTLFAAKKFFLPSVAPDELYIMNPSANNDSDTAIQVKLKNFKTAVQNLTSTVEAQLQKEFEEEQKREKEESSAAASAGDDTKSKSNNTKKDNQQTTTTPYFGRASLYSYKCNVSFIPELDLNEHNWNQTYRGSNPFYSIFSKFGPPRPSKSPAGLIIHVDVSKFVVGSDQEKDTNLKTFIAALAAVHLLNTRFNSDDALKKCVRENPKSISKKATDHAARFYLELLILQQGQKKLRKKDPNFTGSYSDWQDLAKSYGILISVPENEAELEKMIAEYEQYDKSTSRDANNNNNDDDDDGDEKEKTSLLLSKSIPTVDSILDDETAANFKHPHKWNILKERQNFVACHGEWKNYVAYGRFEFYKSHPLVFAFDVAGIPEAESPTHEGYDKVEAQIQRLATIIHSGLNPPYCLSHFVRVNSSNPQCPGIENLMRFSLDCMNRDRPMDQDQKP